MTKPFEALNNDLLDMHCDRICRRAAAIVSRYQSIKKEGAEIWLREIHFVLC